MRSKNTMEKFDNWLQNAFKVEQASLSFDNVHSTYDNVRSNTTLFVYNLFILLGSLGNNLYYILQLECMNKMLNEMHLGNLIYLYTCQYYKTFNNV